MFTFGFLTPATGVMLLAIVLIIFGPGKLPEIGRSVGRGIREFKSANAAGEGNTQQADEK